MTPHFLTRETIVRPRRWPRHAFAIVCGAAIAMFVAVVLVAVQAPRVTVRYVSTPASPGHGR